MMGGHCDSLLLFSVQVVQIGPTTALVHLQRQVHGPDLVNQ